MRDNASNMISLKYFSNCLNDGEVKETNHCDKLKKGDKVEFTVEIKVTECPEKESERNQKFIIQPVCTSFFSNK